MHYKDGTPAGLGDIVVFDDPNSKASGKLIGTVVFLAENGDTCNGRVNGMARVFDHEAGRLVAADAGLGQYVTIKYCMRLLTLLFMLCSSALGCDKQHPQTVMRKHDADHYTAFNYSQREQQIMAREEARTNTTPPVHIMQTSDPQVDVNEVIRLGNSVQELGTGVAGIGDDAIEAMAPPEDDNDKWYISLITCKDCKYCELLKKDFLTNPILQAWVNVEHPEDGWAHYLVFRWEDQTQRDRFKDMKFNGFPTLIVQPPRNQRYGPSSTTVFQKTGYDGNARALSDEMSAAIKLYVKKYEQKRSAVQSYGQLITHKAGQEESTAGQIGTDPPFDLGPKTDPRYPDPGIRLPNRVEIPPEVELARRGVFSETWHYVVIGLGVLFSLFVGLACLIFIVFVFFAVKMIRKGMKNNGSTTSTVAGP